MTEPTKKHLPPDHSVVGAIAFLREAWRNNDGAEGDSVKLVCSELERLRAESRGELRASERQGGDFWQDEALRLTRITSEIHHMRFDPTTTDEKRWARVAELLPGPPPATIVGDALNALMAEVCDNPGVQMECDLASALGVPPGAHEFDEMCSMVEALKEAPSQPAPSADAAMARWVLVAERLPEKAGMYLCFHPDHGQDVILFTGKAWGKTSFWSHEDGTHWMPLPAPPGGGK